jgi:hypothetical protein
MCRNFVRGGLILLALIQGALGLYAYAAPLTFYHGLPFPGHSWVDVLPPYNGHLITDYGILSLSLTVVLGAAAIFLERRLVQAALGGLPGLCGAASGLPRHAPTELPVHRRGYPDRGHARPHRAVDRNPGTNAISPGGVTEVTAGGRTCTKSRRPARGSLSLWKDSRERYQN